MVAGRSQRSASAHARQASRAVHTSGRDDASRPVSRVLSGVASATAIPLGRRLLSASSNQPGRRRGSRWAGGFADTPVPPLFGLAPGGVCRAASVAGRAVRSYRTVSPLPLRVPARAVSSLWHFPWGRPRRPLAATVDPWSPDFPPPGLSRKALIPGRGRPTDWQLE